MTNKKHHIETLLRHSYEFGYDWTRRLGTGFLTPFRFSYRSGHFRSSVKRKAVNKAGAQLPWYTYPAIDFLRTRTFSEKSILEFGAGQSTLWWAQRSARVLSFEGNKDWYDAISNTMPANVDIKLVNMRDARSCVSDVERELESYQQRNSAPKFDVIVIDGLYRSELVPIACRYRSRDGIIICDNAEGYGFREAFEDASLQRIDFAGYAPGVIKPHCTSLYFGENAFITSNDWPMTTV